MCFLPTGAYGSRGRESKCKNIVREMQERLWGFRGGRACIQMKRMTFCRDFIRDFITCLLRDHAGISVFPAGLTLVSSLVYFKLCTCRVQVGETEEVWIHVVLLYELLHKPVADKTLGAWHHVLPPDYRENRNKVSFFFFNRSEEDPSLMLLSLTLATKKSWNIPSVVLFLPFIPLVWNGNSGDGENDEIWDIFWTRAGSFFKDLPTGLDMTCMRFPLHYFPTLWNKWLPFCPQAS